MHQEATTYKESLFIYGNTQIYRFLGSAYSQSGMTDRMTSPPCRSTWMACSYFAPRAIRMGRWTDFRSMSARRAPIIMVMTTKSTMMVPRWWWRRPRRLPTNISILEWMGGWGYSTLKLWGKPKRDNDLWYSRAHALAEPQQQSQQEQEEVTEMTDTVSLCVHVRPTATDADDKREVDVWVFILFTLVEHWSFATMAAKSSWLRCKMCLM